jgi:hypothetical protein
LVNFKFHNFNHCVIFHPFGKKFFIFHRLCNFLKFLRHCNFPRCSPIWKCG